MLHFLESPLKHMLERWDGYGNDPVTTGGPIGKAIKELHLINKETKLPNLKPFVKFSNAAFKNVRLPSMALHETLFQNSDLKKFYWLVKMIVSGKPDKRLLKMKLPTIHKARWLTTAIRILRLYVQTENPSISLKKAVKFIILWYFPMFCDIKRYPLIQDAPRHFFKAIGNYLLHLFFDHKC